MDNDVALDEPQQERAVAPGQAVQADTPGPARTSGAWAVALIYRLAGEPSAFA